MTLNKLHKLLCDLIDQGYGRRQVSIDKTSFSHNLESDGCTILPIACVDVQWIVESDGDGGAATNKNGTERGHTTVILGGSCYELGKPGE